MIIKLPLNVSLPSTRVINPHFPALRSGPTAALGASLQKQIPSSKSNSAYAGLGAAQADIENGATLQVPEHLRTRFRKKLAEESGANKAAMQYLYSHDYEGNFTPQAYLPQGRTYYTPSPNGMELRIKERLDHWRSQFDEKKTKKRRDAP